MLENATTFSSRTLRPTDISPKKLCSASKYGFTKKAGVEVDSLVTTVLRYLMGRNTVVRIRYGLVLRLL
jgi:hypothetical protein